MSNKLLEYQKLDIELKKVKKELNNNQSTKSVENLTGSIKDWQNKILELEETSKTLVSSFKKLMEVQKKGLAYVQKSKNMSIENMTDAELADFDAKMSQTAKQLAELETRILNHNQEVKKVVLDYKMYRKKILDAKDARENLRSQSAEKVQESTPNIDAIKAKQLQLEKEIEPAKLAKYKAMKQDGIFPVYVPLVEKRCGGCRMELSAAALDKLKSGELYECEQCRRIIYSTKD